MRTISLLQRRPVRIASVTYIGTESNGLEEVEAGLVHSAESVDTVYTDPRRDEWNTTIKPALQKISLKRFERMTGKSPADLDRRAEGPQDTPPGTPPAHERQWQMGGAWQHRLCE